MSLQELGELEEQWRTMKISRGARSGVPKWYEKFYQNYICFKA